MLFAFMLGIGHGMGRGLGTHMATWICYIQSCGVEVQREHRMQNQLRSKQKSTTRRVRDKVFIQWVGKGRQGGRARGGDSNCNAQFLFGNESEQRAQLGAGRDWVQEWAAV